MISGFGDGSTLTVVDSPYGRIGSIICWENCMPMLRILTADLDLGDIGCGMSCRARPAVAGGAHPAEETTLIPCIALSANAMPADIRRALDAGFAAYWTKPIDIEAFLAALDAMFLANG